MTATVLPRSDFLRAPVLATARPEDFKEWHHFIVQHPGLHLLVNVSLTSESPTGRPNRLVPRVVVLGHDGRWRGALERFDPAALDISADLGTLTVGGNRLAVGHEGYRIEIDLPERGIAAQLDLTAGGRPTVVAVNNKPLGAGRLNWIYVPRLRADGWVRMDGRTNRLSGAVAYHDHNWGRFRWGDDFGWTWGSVLPTSPESPWSFVFMRMTDRRRLRCLAQALYVWHQDEQVAAFRDAALQVRTSGLLGRAADCTLPQAMRLLLAEASDVPATLTVTAAQADRQVQLVFRPESYARLAQPSEMSLDRSVVLAETAGSARITGSIDGMDLDVAGPGTVELLYG